MLMLKTQDHLFCGERRSTKIVFEHWFTQLGRFTLWHNSRRAKQHSFIDACTRSRIHFPKTVNNNAEKYEGLIQSKILLRVLHALENSTNTDR